MKSQVQPLTCDPGRHRPTTQERLCTARRLQVPEGLLSAHLYTPRLLPGGEAGPEGGAQGQGGPGSSQESEMPHALWGSQSAGAAGWVAAASSSGRFGSSIATGVRWVHQGGLERELASGSLV